VARQSVLPDENLVGVWVVGGSQGMSIESGESSLLEFAEDGTFRYFGEDENGKRVPSKRFGTYSISGSMLVMQYDGSARPDESEYQLKGHMLLVRQTGSQLDHYGQPYWNVHYFRPASTKQNPFAFEGKDALASLRDQVVVAGSLTMETKSFSTWNSSGTFTEWILDLTLTNGLLCSIDLGNTLLVAQLGENGLPIGFVRIRGNHPLIGKEHTAAQPNLSYMLDGFDSTDGGRTISISGATMVSNCDGDHPPYAGFGQIHEKAEHYFFETMSPSTWMKPEAVVGTLAVLPEFIITTDDGIERYQAIVWFGEVNAERDKHVWSVKRVEFFPVRKEALHAILTGADETLFKKILAMNWLALSDMDGAASLFAKAFTGKTPGNLLGATLTCYSQHGLTGLGVFAAQLEYDAETPVGIQTRASQYLDKIGYERSGVASYASFRQTKDGESTKAFGEEDPKLGHNQRLAVPFMVQSDTTLRRVVLDVARYERVSMAIHSDNAGKPGPEVEHFESSGTDCRGTTRLSAGKTYWVVVAGESAPGWADPYWSRCKAFGIFGAYATSSDGGATWAPGDKELSLKVTIYCKAD